MIKCNFCGKEMSEYVTVCPNCGRTADGSIKEIRKTNSKKSNRTSAAIYKIIFIVVCVITLASLFVFVCSLNAYNAIVGKSPLGIGAIFFYDCIVLGVYKPVIVTATISAFILLAMLTAVIFLAIRSFRTSSKNK